VLALLAAQPAHARAHHSDAWAREHFAGRRAHARGAKRPASTRADSPGLSAGSECLPAGLSGYACFLEGRSQRSLPWPKRWWKWDGASKMDNILKKAIVEYKFLRREYPGSKYRADGLFTVAEIYKDDLNDSQAARASFQEFLHHYPRNRLADDARQAILEIDQQALAEKQGPSQPVEEPARPLKDANHHDE